MQIKKKYFVINTIIIISTVEVVYYLAIMYIAQIN